MGGIVVLRLRYIRLAVERDVAGIEIHVGSGEQQEATFVSDLLPKEAVVEAIPPRRPIGVGDGFKDFV